MSCNAQFGRFTEITLTIDKQNDFSHSYCLQITFLKNAHAREDRYGHAGDDRLQNYIETTSATTCLSLSAYPIRFLVVRPAEELVLTPRSGPRPVQV